MERKNANIDDVIRTVETASTKELEVLAGIREAIEGLNGGRVATGDPVSRSVLASIRAIENSRPDIVASAPPVDPVIEAMKRLNLGDVSHTVWEDVAQQKQRAKPTAKKDKKRRSKAIPEDVKVQRTEAAEHAREMFGQKGGSQKTQNQRDARGRFTGKSGSKVAAEDARAERAEKARRKEDDERLNAESGLLKKLSQIAEGIGDPSETRAVDALGYAMGGPLWAAGKEIGGITKEVGSTLNGARKSIADVIRGNDDNGRRKGFFRRKSNSSADVVQINTQKRTVQELQDQTSEIKEGNDKILSALDRIAKNTGKKNGGLLSKLLALLGKGAGGIASLIFGRGSLKNIGSMLLGALGIKKMASLLGFGGKKTAAKEAGELATRGAGKLATKGVGKLGVKALAKGALRAIPVVGTVAGGIYDAVTGWNDTEAQRRTFGLKDGEDPSFQQKAAYTLANVLDMGGLVSGISSAIGGVLKSLGFENIGNMLQSFSTESIAQAIDGGITNLETYISNLGNTISTTFNDYTARIGDAISAWFSDTTKSLNEKLDAIKNFFTVDNLKQVFRDAIDSAIDFIKNPVEHIKEAGSNLLNKLTELPSKAADLAVEAVKSTPVGMATSMLVNKAEAKEVTPELKTSVKEIQENNTPKSEETPKKANIVTRVVNASLDTAKDSNKTVKETANQIVNANAVETGKSAVQKIDAAIGQNSPSSVSRNTTITGARNDIQKAADTYNNGNLDVKVGSLDAEGKANLDKLAPYFAELEKKYGLPEGTLYAIAATESNGNPNAVSQLRWVNGKKSGGALGMFQFTSVAREETGLSREDSFNPEKSAEAAALLMSKYLKQAKGDLNEAITAYNAGFGTINKWKKGTGDLSKENREYAIKVNTHRARYLGGDIYTPGAGSQGGRQQQSSQSPGMDNLPENAFVDPSTGLVFTPGENPFEKGGLIERIGEFTGTGDLLNKFLSARGMRREVVPGTLEERARGKGTDPFVSPAPKTPQQEQALAINQAMEDSSSAMPAPKTPQQEQALAINQAMEDTSSAMPAPKTLQQEQALAINQAIEDSSSAIPAPKTPQQEQALAINQAMAATGNAYADASTPAEKARPVANSSYFAEIGNQIGVDGLYDKLINARGMRTNVPSQSAASPQVATASSDLQQPTGRMQIDGQVISDLGGSGAKPTMQLADNTVSLDGETKRMFAQMTALLARIEEHTKDASKGQGAVVKVSSPQPGVTRTVPLSIDDPLMNDYSRVD